MVLFGVMIHDHNRDDHDDSDDDIDDVEFQVWQLRCDVHILDHGGNLIDACTLATMAALRHFRRPGKKNHADSAFFIERGREQLIPCSPSFLFL